MVGIGRSCCGVQEPFPSRKVARAPGPLESISESVDEGGAPREFFSKPFEFLSLGLLAYVGAPPNRGRALKVCTEVACCRSVTLFTAVVRSIMTMPIRAKCHDTCCALTRPCCS